MQTGGQIYTNDYLVAMGGVHVGGTSDPGTDNLIVDGDLTVSGGDLTVSGGVGDATFLLEADTDNSGEGDQPKIVLSQDGGIVKGHIGFTGSTNHLRIANEWDNSDADIDFQTAGSTVMTITGDGKILDKDNKEITGRTCHWVSCGYKSYNGGSSCGGYGGSIMNFNYGDCGLSSGTRIASVSIKYRSCNSYCNGYWYPHYGGYAFTANGVDYKAYSVDTGSECVVGSYYMYVQVC
jgi:hypothetical protein